MASWEASCGKMGTVSTFTWRHRKTENPYVKMAGRPVAGPTGCLLTPSRQWGSHRLIFIVEAVFSVRYGLNVCNFDRRPVTAEAPVLPGPFRVTKWPWGRSPTPSPRQERRLSHFADAPCTSSSSWHLWRKVTPTKGGNLQTWLCCVGYRAVLDSKVISSCFAGLKGTDTPFAECLGLWLLFDRCPLPVCPDWCVSLCFFVTVSTSKQNPQVYC